MSGTTRSFPFITRLHDSRRLCICFGVAMDTTSSYDWNIVYNFCTAHAVSQNPSQLYDHVKLTSSSTGCSIVYMHDSVLFFGGLSTEIWYYKSQTKAEKYGLCE